jgi:hypothetical protein
LDLVGVIGQRVGRDHLHRMEGRAIREMHERDAGLGVAARAHPALDGDGRVLRRLSGQDGANVELGSVHRARVTEAKRPCPDALQPRRSRCCRRRTSIGERVHDRALRRILTQLWPDRRDCVLNLGMSTPAPTSNGVTDHSSVVSFDTTGWTGHGLVTTGASRSASTAGSREGRGQAEIADRRVRESWPWKSRRARRNQSDSQSKIKL